MPKTILNKIFGYDNFRRGQEEVIEAVLSNSHTLAVMPTGSGKSICFQIPALIKGGLTIVVSPLVALMEDQVAALKLLGIDAETINSSRERSSNVRTWKSVAEGQVKILYLAPERLMTANMIAALSNLPVNLVVIDEAHCLSRWGPSFRPDYEALVKLRHIFREVPIVALTATADKSTQTDIVTKLFGGKGLVFVSGFDRPNINLNVTMKGNTKHQLLDVVRAHPNESGIVYCLSRSKTEKTTQYLSERGFNAVPYHAGMSASTRLENQRAFMADTEGMIVVATIAFGMGIDKPDIRFVIHMDMPGNIESYYQEIGRAGRDGKPAVAHMIYGFEDLRTRRLFIEQEDSDVDHKRREHKRLDALISYCESSECRRYALLAYFNEQLKLNSGCNNCDICLHPPELLDGTEAAQKLLSTAAETGQIFGQAYLIDILLGAKTEKIKSNNHDRLTFYGSGIELDRNTWRTIIRQLVAGGYLKLDVVGYGGLSLRPRGQKILTGERKFNFRNDVIKSVNSNKVNHSGKISSRNMTKEQSELLAGLKEKRTELARKRRVPPFMIFSDRSLEDMAQFQPRDEASFAMIHGVGAAKLRDFGTEFISVVNEHNSS